MVWLTPTRRFGVTRGRWLRWSPTSLSVLILRRRCMWVLPTLMLLRRWRSWSAYCWPLTAMWTFASEANVHIAVSGQQYALQLLHLLRSISVGNTHIHRLLRISTLKEVGLH